VNRQDSYDNALAKTINGLYKAEVIPMAELSDPCPFSICD
jgi:hypothetical protein